ncbi:DM13 domain-containing protein [Tunicatimonas pelagia]|uniref:DM13 domain-containing protein n=1 Tax=Tunicatimonas pelagia TaxID=931531 RepID=UPI0026660AB1|nr:DM13 domain-containing protein [Tunicatimonas pelagia]WKN42702.1 DM13 domain-containing protein [Tunicatimonas pelagia]
MLFKNLFLSAFMIVGMLAMVSCEDDTETVTETIDSSVPTGDLMVQRQGTFVDQNNKSTAGMVQVGTDQDGESFLRFGNDFTTDLATGTVTIYFSTSDELIRDAGAGNPNVKLVGAVQGTGEDFFKLSSAPENRFTHVILWCESVGIPFGNAQLQ